MQEAAEDRGGGGDVDMQDADEFVACYSSPGNTALGPGCSLFDFDDDQDVDLIDFAEFQGLFNP